MTKYKAIPTTVDGIWFASKLEAKRYQELKLLERAGAIKELSRQHKFPLVVSGAKICSYAADFVYIDTRTEAMVIEDTKGVRTQSYRIKYKLFHVCYPHLKITEVTK